MFHRYPEAVLPPLFLLAVLTAPFSWAVGIFMLAAGRFARALTVVAGSAGGFALGVLVLRADNSFAAPFLLATAVVSGVLISFVWFLVWLVRSPLEPPPPLPAADPQSGERSMTLSEGLLVTGLLITAILAVFAIAAFVALSQ